MRQTVARTNLITTPIVPVLAPSGDCGRRTLSLYFRGPPKPGGNRRAVERWKSVRPNCSRSRTPPPKNRVPRQVLHCRTVQRQSFQSNPSPQSVPIVPVDRQVLA